MRLEGLDFPEGAKELVKALEELPDGLIEGVSERTHSIVSAESIGGQALIIIKGPPSSYEGTLSVLYQDFPDVQPLRTSSKQTFFNYGNYQYVVQFRR